MITLFNVLEFEEGYRDKPYYCSEGYPTIGIGTKIGTKGAPLEQYTLTINRSIAEELLDKEVLEIKQRLSQCDWYNKLNHDRRVIIESMCYQLGFNGAMKFKKMIAALGVEDWNEAHNQALDSLWARQTPQRANRHADVLLSGNLQFTYGELV